MQQKKLNKITFIKLIQGFEQTKEYIHKHSQRSTAEVIPATAPENKGFIVQCLIVQTKMISVHKKESTEKNDFCVLGAQWSCSHKQEFIYPFYSRCAS